MLPVRWDTFFGHGLADNVNSLASQPNKDRRTWNPAAQYVFAERYTGKALGIWDKDFSKVIKMQ
jgi:hypothetical protein